MTKFFVDSSNNVNVETILTLSLAKKIARRINSKNKNSMFNPLAEVDRLNKTLKISYWDEDLNGDLIGIITEIKFGNNIPNCYLKQ